MLVLSWISPFYAVWNPSLQGGTAHNQDGVTLLSGMSQEMSSWTPEVYVPGDSRACQVNNEDESS